MEEPGRDRVAVVAFVCSVVALIPLAIPLGFTALRRIAVSGRRGEGLAWGALVLSAVWVLVALIVSTTRVYGDSLEHQAATRTKAPTPSVAPRLPATEGRGSPFSVEVGTCFDFDEVFLPIVYQVTFLPCTSPHDAELYAIVTLAPEQWPGEQEIVRLTTPSCAHWRPARLDPDRDYPGLRHTVIAPTEDFWDLGSNLAACVFRGDKGKLTTPARDTGVPR